MPFGGMRSGFVRPALSLTRLLLIKPPQEMKRTPGDFSFEKFKSKRKPRVDSEDEDASPPRKHRTKPQRFGRTAERDASFRCKKCKTMVGQPLSGTGQRNHCPVCLHSLHLDYRPGDRAADCGSLMEPISIWVRADEWVLLHRCMGCGVIHSNRIAPDDNEIVLLSLAARPLGRPAFPLHEEAES